MIYHKTHIDTDALGCQLVVKLFADIHNEEVSVSYCDRSTIDQSIEETLKVIKPDDSLLISDITPSHEMCERLTKINDNTELVINCIDHHKADLDKAENNDWVDIRTTGPDNKPISATKLIYNDLMDSLIPKSKLFISKKVADVIVAIDHYDTFQWIGDDNTVHNMESLVIDCCVKKYGLEETLSKIHDLIMNDDVPVVICPETFHDGYSLAADKLIKSKEVYSDMIKIGYTHEETKTGYKAGLFIHTDASLAAHMALGGHPDLEMVIVKHPNKEKYSFRTRYDHVDLSQILKEVGGGGHAKAGGSSKVPERIDEAFKLLMNKYNS